MKINDKLREYIEKNIFPEYQKNEKAHDINHIKYVIERSFELIKDNNLEVNPDIVYTVASYHDIGHHIDPKTHEKVSADIMSKDENLKEFFNEEDLKTIKEAIEDHRASSKHEPRSIYGKIVSSADRNNTVEACLKRTYFYGKKLNPEATDEELFERAYNVLQEKFGKDGYAKFYFKDTKYETFLKDLRDLLSDKENYINTQREYINKIKKKHMSLKEAFEELKKQNSNMSLDELLYEVYNKVKDDYNESFDVVRNMILEENGINELEYYTKNVNPELKKYIIENIFPEYEKNDGGHNLAHILEVIRRSFALNDTFKLGLDDNMIYAIASCHDWGKYIDHETHHLIAAKNFISDEGMKKFFNDEDRKTIMEAIEDHRSSKEDEPRSTYGKLISSADRNTRIEIVFIRSFFVAHERMPEENIEDYLNYTIKRLSKKYDEENPENMFYEDETYKEFIKDMRDLLKREEDFKKRYCEVNHITSRNNRVMDEPGELSYTKVLIKNNYE